MRRLLAFLLTVAGTLLPLAYVAGLIALAFYLAFRTGFHALGLKAILIVGLALFGSLRALFRAADEPEGTPVDRSEAPEFFAMIDDIVRRAQCRPFDRVLISDDMNCAIYERPRAGILGFTTSYLIVGLPLMASLTPPQLEAVLAHECGHIAGRHGKTGARYFSMLAAWTALALQLKRHGGFLSLPLIWFYNVLIPAFNRVLVPIRQEQELDADRLAAEVTNPLTIASALVAIGVRTAQLELEFWPAILRKAITDERPPADVYEKMSSALQNPWRTTDVPASAFVSVEPGDDHPPTKDRVTALGVDWDRAVLAASDASSARADRTYLPRTLGTVLSRQWANSMSAFWLAQHEAQRSNREQLESLDAVCAGAGATSSDRRAQALLAARLDREDAVTLLRSYFAEHPEDGEVAFAFGKAAMPADPQIASQAFETASQDLRYAVAALGDLAQYYAVIGEEKMAGAYVGKRLEAESALETLAPQTSPSSPLQSPNLTTSESDALMNSLRRWPQIERAYIGKTSDPRYPLTPIYFCALKRDANKGNIDAETFAKNVFESSKFPGITHPVVADHENNWLLSRLRDVSGSLVFQRGA